MKSLLPTIAGLLFLGSSLAQTPAAPAAPAAASATVRRLELPLETGKYREAPGVQLAQTFCITCHSSEYAENQAPLPDAYWAGTVKKMKEKFGATIPDEALEGLTKYMIEAYGAKKAK